MLRSQAGRLHSLLLLSDLVLAAVVFLGVLEFQTPEIFSQVAGRSPLGATAPFLGVILAGSLAWPVLLDAFGLYESQRRTSLAHLLVRFALVAVLAETVTAVAALALRVPLGLPFLLVAAVAQYLVIGGSRLAILVALRTARRLGRNWRNVVLVGSGPRARRALDQIVEHPEWGLRVVGLLDEYDQPVDPSLAALPIYKLLHAQHLFREATLDEVIVACPRSMLTQIEPIASLCAAVGVPMTVLSDLYSDHLPTPRASEFGGEPSLSFAMVSHSRAMLACKRTLDVVGAAGLLLAAGPVLGLSALAIRLTSRGPILFRQQRVGLNGRRFSMLKLRTMCEDAEQRRAEFEHLNEMDGPVFKIRNDPRITPVGRLLRRLSLDELPQLWNVLSGDMSLVGPRPPIPGEVDRYHVNQRRRLSMRPGLTCLWQVGRRNDTTFEDWVRLDLEYIDRWSLMLDFRILIRTVGTVVRGTGC